MKRACLLAVLTVQLAGIKLLSSDWGAMNEAIEARKLSRGGGIDLTLCVKRVLARSVVCGQSVSFLGLKIFSRFVGTADEWECLG